MSHADVPIPSPESLVAPTPVTLPKPTESSVEIPALIHYTSFQHRFLGRSHRVYRRGDGPPVLVLAEMPGITPRVVAFADRLVDVGLSVYLPHLFGTDGAPASLLAYARTLPAACVSAQFAALRRETTAPATLWLRDLMRRACGWTNSAHAGVVGMCFTGGFALGMLMEPELIAPVLAQPSLPLGGRSAAADLGLDPNDLKDVRRRVEADGVQIMGLRFSQDRLCPKSRFDRLEGEFGSNFVKVTIPSGDDSTEGVPKNAHSVLTEHLVDEPGHPTREALDDVIAFLTQRLVSPASTL